MIKYVIPFVMQVKMIRGKTEETGYCLRMPELSRLSLFVEGARRGVRMDAAVVDETPSQDFLLPKFK